MLEILKTAFLISGGGTTAEAVIKSCQEGKLKGIEPVVVISSKQGVEGLKRAEALSVPTEIVSRREFASREAFGDDLLVKLEKYGVNLVSQNGWLPLTPVNVVREYKNNIINQHPGKLDPSREIDFGGNSMYGNTVSCATIIYSWLTGQDFWTEASEHHVTEDEKYDKGKLIRVVRLDFESIPYPITIADIEQNPQVLLEQTEKVQQRLLPLEHQNVIEALRMFAEGRNTDGFIREQPLIPKDLIPIAIAAKKLAVKLTQRKN